MRLLAATYGHQYTGRAVDDALRIFVGEGSLRQVACAMTSVPMWWSGNPAATAPPTVETTLLGLDIIMRDTSDIAFIQEQLREVRT